MKEAPREVINVVVVDDNEILLRHLCDFLKPLTEIDVSDVVIRSVFHALRPETVSSDQTRIDFDATMQRISPLAPGVAVIDLRLAGDDESDCSGLELSTLIMRAFKDCRIVLVSSYFGTTPGLIENFKFRVDRHQADYGEELKRKFTGAVKSRASADPPSRAQNPIYVSYARDDSKGAWGHQEEIANRIETSLRKHGYDVRRDRTDLNYGESIRAFMKQIGRGGCVVAVVSDKYLRSRHCMFELLEVYRNQGFRHRKLCPVVLPSATINDLGGRLSYVHYWAGQVSHDEDLLRGTEITVLPPRELKAFQRQLVDIANNAGQLLEFIADTNCLTPETLEQDDFFVLRRRIDQCLK